MPSTWVKVLLSATPVTIPGRAIGSIDEEGDRLAAEEAVAGDRERGEGAEHERDRRWPPGPTLTEVQKASRAPWFSIAFGNHSVVSPGGGHLRVVCSR